MQLEDFKVSDDIEIDETIVFFQLINGKESALIQIEGEVVRETFDLHRAGESCEMAVPVDFEWIEVAKEKYEVVEASVETDDFELTDNQIIELNEKLKERMERCTFW